MLATPASPPLRDPRLVYEPKFDGIRALVDIQPAAPGPRVTIWSRLGNDKTGQFPDLVRVFATFGRKVRVPVLLDGEIVALDRSGKPVGFQALQARIHLAGAKQAEEAAGARPVAFLAFDLLRQGDEDLRPLPFTERRARLERLLARRQSPALRLIESLPADGGPLRQRAVQEGWEGLIVKDAASPYHSGRRSPAWRKLKITQEQEFVIGGWTEPRQTRQFFGALLLGVYEAASEQSSNRQSVRPQSANPQSGSLHSANPPLIYVGHTGTGFDQAGLERLHRMLKRLETPVCPFAERPKTNQPPHWVRPELVAQVRFTEWTDDGKLRHPVYRGLRDDVRPEAVRRERPAGSAASVSAARRSENPAETGRPPPRRRRAGAPTRRIEATTWETPTAEQIEALDAQLRDLEARRRDGVLHLSGGQRLEITNPAKVFWPELKLTKGDLLRYYVQVSPFILPAVADRPLVMKRFPNGIDGKAFYQQRVRTAPPAGVRIVRLPDEIDPIDEPDVPRFVGGSLMTLLYMTQIAAISQDPWFSRVQSPIAADYMALDLDPMEGVPFARVLDVARWVRDELESLGVPGVPKTSGSTGLHVYIPMPPGTTYEAGQLFCQIIATVVATKQPKVATVERSVARRGKTVYVDYLQNILGKTLATAYSARASEYAGASTPLTWEEVEEGFDPREFTIRTLPGRLREVGDLWARLRTSAPADLHAVFERYA
jgi:bifunctional non-homologous end joining protein LigD